MRLLRTSLLVTTLMASFAAAAQQPVLPTATEQQIKAAAAMPFRNAELPLAQRVDDLVSRMTLEEKVSQLIDRAAAIPRLDVPAYNWWNEGLHGIARSGYATTFPQAIGNAATWDAPLLNSISTVISTEARAKYNDAILHGNFGRYYGLTIWSPNINIFRDPRWGRGQETYGEDPFLTSRLGVAFVKGIQGDDPNYFRAIATPKHFAVHSGPETTRHQVDIDPSDHDLWDTYLPAFRALIVEGKADSIMCAYNAVDKVPACASKLLLEDILRRDWGFQGFVTADCGAVDDFSQKNGHHFSTDHETGSAAGIEAGTDTDCGSSYTALTEAVHKGLIKETQVDVSVKRLFLARMKLGMFDPPAKVSYASIPFTVVNSPANEALALRAARESMVLLKNDGDFLPLKPSANRTVAVIGPLAASLIALEGNYSGVPMHPILPVDGIVAEFGADHVLYAEGSPFVMGGALTVPRTFFRATAGSSVEGLTAEYFATPDFESKPEMTRVDKELDFDWAAANPVPSLSANTSAGGFAVRWTGTITSPVAATQTFTIRGNVDLKLYLDGKLLDPLPPPAPASGAAVAAAAPSYATGVIAAPARVVRSPTRYAIPFNDTNPHAIRVEYVQAKRGGGAFGLEWSPDQTLLQKQAVETASKADVVVAFVGLTSRLEGEEMQVNAKGFKGGDRTDLVLPDVQQELLEAIARTGKPMVVVLLNGSALAVNWSQQNAKAILEAWYPGQSGGQAIAETLTGKNNPAGRLPLTFYASVDQLPAFEDYSMANRTYRYFKGKPLFAFGDGLSYTRFAYSNLKLSTKNLHAGDTLTVEADVKNIGAVAGEEVGELYLLPPHTAISPALALAGFERVHLNAGETRHLTFRLDPRTLSQVDDKGVRAVVAGSYQVSLGGSQPSGDAGAAVKTESFVISGSQQLPR